MESEPADRSTKWRKGRQSQTRVEEEYKEDFHYETGQNHANKRKYRYLMEFNEKNIINSKY